VKYAFIERHRRLWPICVQCRVLLVSVSGFHQHLARRVDIAKRRHLSGEVLLVHISAVYAENRGAYGWPRIWRQLRAQGIRVGKQRVQRLMQKHGIQARGKRRFRVVTTDSKHSLPVAPNVLTVHAPPSALDVFIIHAPPAILDVFIAHAPPALALSVLSSLVAPPQAVIATSTATKHPSRQLNCE